MAKIISTEDCGNAPKKQFIKDFCIANANADIDAVLNMLAADISLDIVGYKTARGVAQVRAVLSKDMSRSSVTELKIENILSHGDRCAANGVLKFEDGGIVAFCNIYVFSGHSKSAKIKEISTYSVNLTSSGA